MSYLFYFSDTENYTASSPEPLSKQVLVTPSWRDAEKNNAQKIRSSTSASNPNISNLEQRPKQSGSRHTIWDIPEKKYEPSPVATVSSSWDNKPNYFPSKSNTHFSFLPKAETRPGFITPAYGGDGSRLSLKTDRKSPPRPFKSKTSGSASDLRKSCLKTQSTQSLKSRSQSPTVVKFSPKNTKKGYF